MADIARAFDTPGGSAGGIVGEVDNTAIPDATEHGRQEQAADGTRESVPDDETETVYDAAVRDDDDLRSGSSGQRLEHVPDAVAEL